MLMLKSLAGRHRLLIEREKRSKAASSSSWSDIIAAHGGTDGPT